MEASIKYMIEKHVDDFFDISIYGDEIRFGCYHTEDDYDDNINLLNDQIEDLEKIGFVVQHNSGIDDSTETVIVMQLKKMEDTLFD